MHPAKILLSTAATLTLIGAPLADERVVQFELLSEHAPLNNAGSAPFLPFNTLTSGSIVMTESFENPHLAFSDLKLSFDTLPDLTFDRLNAKSEPFYGCSASPYSTGSDYYEGTLEDTWAFQEIVVRICPELLSADELNLQVHIGFKTGESWIGGPMEPEVWPLVDFQVPAKNVTPVRIVDQFETVFLDNALQLDLQQAPGEVYGDTSSSFGFKLQARWMGHEDKVIAFSSMSATPMSKAIGFDIQEDPNLPEFDRFQIRVRYKEGGVINTTEFQPLFMLMDAAYGPLDLPPMPY